MTDDERNVFQLFLRVRDAIYDELERRSAAYAVEKKKLTKGQRSIGVPGYTHEEQALLERALAWMSEVHDDLISLSRDIAPRLAVQRGDVDSVDVFEVLRAAGFGEAELRRGESKGRWMGAAIQRCPGLKNSGKTRKKGSHLRPVTIWLPE